ncbi:MAG: enoyl-CoA hydratase/isomerase family protein [Dehalococcoidia bacterium]|jgi:enoyl-CoA hydratase/carnithine racemase|nr:enoyl-CoA hydratase/isomerase family protein [Dehalococcoidia bacterium]MDP7200325.1 enoyl-CoA hydratase/isomerase family protein [Dehalococcoidia bacterium]MDP7511542.1 enoyl-CoA hydratase/isomerase family protein [Dehalococcoidia bacterium]HJN87884.1 enoyl-CoA hydratase/isomerase family protein [Dehalococcoidia bacterium]|tara:strand:- start:37 stop:765 length:729 start_codon:yes stop_codon:yes gene_type:complete
MPAFDTLLYDKDGAVAHISLNRPKVLNAYNIQMRDDFSEALAAVVDDTEVRALLITGEGRAFCAGADLTEFGTAPSLAIARQVRWERDVWGQLLHLPIPVVVAPHGYCIGSGVEIVLLGDIRVGAAGTVFAMPEVHLGMIPAAGGTQTLPRSLGRSGALYLLLTGRRFDAAEALRLGLLTRLVAEEDLLGEAWRIVRRLAGLDPDLAEAAKACLRRGGDVPLPEGLRLEARVASRVLARDRG